MQFTLAVTALFAALAAAAPSDKARRDEPYVALTYWAAADNTFVLALPVDGSQAYVGSDLSFTSISSNAPAGVVCQSYGIDGAVTTLYGSAYGVPIGLLQEQPYAKCWYP